MASVFQELARERQENLRLLRAHQDKDDLIGKLKEEIDLLNRVSPVRSARLGLACFISAGLVSGSLDGFFC